MIDGQFTLGVEEEYQIVDPETRELRSYVSQIMDEGGQTILRERVRPEMHQSMVEVGTTICNDVGEVQVRADGDARRARPAGAQGRPAHRRRLHAPVQRLEDAGDHRSDRYHNIVDDLQDVARANLIFGLHVHVGIKDKQVAMALANQVRYFLPHLLALTTSSPFWLGRKTRPDEQPQPDLQALPAHRHPRRVRELRAAGELRQAAREDGLHRQRQEALVGRARALPLRHRRASHLRHAHVHEAHPGRSWRSSRR